MPQRVFLSYSHDDRELAARLSAKLRSAGLAVFDPEAIGTGELIHRAIESAIAAADLFIFLDPGRSGAGGWASTELAWAMERATAGDLPLLPVLVRDGRGVTESISSRFRGVTIERGDANTPAVVEAALAILNDRTGISPTPSSARPKPATDTLLRLLDTDLAKAPAAAAVVVDELVRRVPRGDSRGAKRLEMLRRISGWASESLGLNHPSAVSAQAQLARALEDLGRFKEASAVLSSSLEEANRSIGSDSSVSLDLSLRLARAHQRQGNLETSRAVLEHVLSAAAASGNRHAAAIAGLALAEVLAQEGRSDASRAALFKALELGDDGGDEQARLATLLRLARVLTSTSEFSASHGPLKVALRTIAETGDARTRVNALLALADLYKSTGEESAARSTLSEASEYAIRVLGEEDLLSRFARERTQESLQ